MGLDGISINQLRVSSEFNSSESNAQIIAENNIESRAVNGLSEGQRVNPEKDREHKNSQNGNSYDNDNGNPNEDQEEIQEEQVTKYDLSDASKFVLKLDEENNLITIVEKETQEVVQVFNATQLLNFVMYAPNSYGFIISKKL